MEACPKVTKNLDNQKYDDVKQFCLPSADTNGKSMKELIDEEICPPYIIGKSMNEYMLVCELGLDPATGVHIKTSRLVKIKW